MTGYNYDVALISVTDIETAAVMQMYADWHEKAFDDDGQLYFETSFSRVGIPRRVVTAKQNEMGMTAGATLSMKLIEHFRPRYLIMVGISAGVANSEIEQQIYGDVVVADVIWNYSAGKFVSPEKADIKFGEVGFIPRPTVIKMKPELIPYINAASQSAENQCHIYMGPMASGSAVVANSEVLDKQIRSQFRHTAGLDMEAYAIMYAAENATKQRPIPIIIKSVCDYADSRKSDQYQKFAAYTSCEFAKLLYENYLPFENDFFTSMR